jgi:cell division protein FtsQ
MPDASYVRDGGKSRRNKGFLAIALSLAALALASGAVFLAGSRIKVGKWLVETSQGMPADALRRRLEEKYSGSSFYSIDARGLEAELAAEPMVRTAKVEKAFPATVKVSLVGREGLLAAICEIDGRSRELLIDGEGVAFQIGADSDLPVLSGLRFENPKAGMRLPESLLPLVRSVAEIKETGAGILAAVSEIRFVRKSTEGGECLIYLVGSRVPVRSGAGISAQTLKSAALIQDVMKKRGIEDSVREIDLRSGAIVYKTKEGGA